MDLNGRGRKLSGVEGMNVPQMLESPLKAYLLWGIEPGFDVANPAESVKTLRSAGKVVVVASHAASGLFEMGDVILPLAAGGLVYLAVASLLGCAYWRNFLASSSSDLGEGAA